MLALHADECQGHDNSRINLPTLKTLKNLDMRNMWRVFRQKTPRSNAFHPEPLEGISKSVWYLSRPTISFEAHRSKMSIQTN